MPIEIVPFTPELVPLVAAFNQRMTGSGWGWYEDPIPDWIPKTDPAQQVWKEYWLALEDKKFVRGAYALKPQPWLIRGETKIVTDWQGPVSEGIVDRKYNLLALRLIRDMLKRRPLLYSWGHGGEGQPMLQLLRSLQGWLFFETPFCLRILRPNRFLRLNTYLRREPERARVLDLLASTGAGHLGIKALHAALELRGRSGGGGAKASATRVERFGEWADDVWERSKGRYPVIAVRDRESMNLLVPHGKWPHGVKLQVKRGDATIGWAVVLDNKLYDDDRFGDMRVGSIVDVLAEPEDARDVVRVAFDFLADRGVDLVVSNQAHPAWADAFAANGFVVLKNKRLWAASPELLRAIEPLDEIRNGIHLTNMDGHGPHSL